MALEMRSFGYERVASFGHRFRTRREQRGYTRESLATRAGLSVSTLARIENGREEHPRLHVLGAMLRAIRVDANRAVADERAFEALVLRELAEL